MNKEKNIKFGLSERTIRELNNIFKNYPDIQEVFIFGSRAKGNFKIGSDIDLAIMNTGLNTKTITHALADCSESSLPVAVDLVDFHSLTNQELIEHILRVGEPFYTSHADHDKSN